MALGSFQQAGHLVSPKQDPGVESDKYILLYMVTPQIFKAEILIYSIDLFKACAVFWHFNQNNKMGRNTVE